MRNSSRHIVFVLLTWLIAKDKPRHHWRRYLLGAGCSVLATVILAAAYMVLLPKRFTSEWSVILPGAGVEARVSLERIGQAQMSANSPFNEKALSPRVNYKQIAESRSVLAKAARTVGLTPEEFGEPRIKLIDQTSIMEFQIRAPSAEEAQARAAALFQAMKAKLDELRDDEIRWRNMAIRNSITDVETNLKEARTKILDLQISSGLASIEQFNQLVGSIEALRRDQASIRAQLADRRNQVASLGSAISLSPSEAATLLGLSADPELRKLRDVYANASAVHAESLRRLGQDHPRLREQQERLVSISTVLKGAHGEKTVDHLPLQPNGLLRIDNERFQTVISDLVQKHSEMVGLEAKLSEFDTVLEDYEGRRRKLGVVAAQLEDLQRDHLVANAVFSSAVARIDATKSDIYASYPLLQLLVPPSLPDAPSSPRALFAVLGIIAGSVLSLIGWTFAWLHQWFLFHRLERKLFRSSPLPNTALTTESGH